MLLAISDLVQIQLVTVLVTAFVWIFGIALFMSSREQERWRQTEWELHARLDELAQRMANNPLPPPRQLPAHDELADLRAAYVTNGIPLEEFEEQVGHHFGLTDPPRIVQRRAAQIAHHEKDA